MAVPLMTRLLSSGLPPAPPGPPPPPSAPPSFLPPPPSGSWFDKTLARMPVIAIGLFGNTTLAHWGSAAGLAAANTVLPRLSGIAPIFFNPDAGVTPTLIEYFERYGAVFVFNAGFALPLFAGAEVFCSRDPKGRAWWRKALHVDGITRVAKKLWNGLTNLRPVKSMDAQLTNGLLRRRDIRVGKETVRLEVDHWKSVKDDVVTGGLYLKEFLLRGVIGVMSLMGRRMTGPIAWAEKFRGRLQARPLQSLAHRLVHNRVLRHELTPDQIERLRVADASTRLQAIDTLVEREIAKRASVDRWMQQGRLSAPLRSADNVMAFVGRVFPRTSGQFAGFLTDISANIGTDVVSANILAGGGKSLLALSGPSAIVSVAGAWTNTGLAQNMRRSPDEPGWSYGETFTRRMMLAVPRSIVFRALCVSGATTPLFKVLAQLGIGAYSLYQADEWSRRVLEHRGAVVPLASAGSDSEMRDRIRRQYVMALMRAGVSVI